MGAKAKRNTEQADPFEAALVAAKKDQDESLIKTLTDALSKKRRTQGAPDTQPTQQQP